MADEKIQDQLIAFASQVGTDVKDLKSADSALSTLIGALPTNEDGSAKYADFASYIASVQATASGDLGDFSGIVDASGTAPTTVADALSNINAKFGDLNADFTGDDAVSSDDGKVTVGIKEEGGVITSVTVATDDIASASGLSDLVTLVGAESLGEDEDDIVTRLGAVEEAIEEALGDDGSVSQQISDAIGTLGNDADDAEATDVAGAIAGAEKRAKDYADGQIAGAIGSLDDFKDAENNVPETVADAISNAVAKGVASVYTVKGSQDTYAELPADGNTVGDVWNVVAAEGNTPAGTNYVWTGTEWDALGGTVDLSSENLGKILFMSESPLEAYLKALGESESSSETPSDEETPSA